MVTLEQVPEQDLVAYIFRRRMRMLMRWVMSPARRKTFMASDWRNPRNGGGFGGRERAGEARGTKGFGCGFGEEKVTWQRGGASVLVFFVHVYN